MSLMRRIRRARERALEPLAPPKTAFEALSNDVKLAMRRLRIHSGARLPDEKSEDVRKNRNARKRARGSKS